LLFENETPMSYSKGLRGAFLCRLEVYQTAIIYYKNPSKRFMNLSEGLAFMLYAY